MIHSVWTSRSLNQHGRPDFLCLFISLPVSNRHINELKVFMVIRQMHIYTHTNTHRHHARHNMHSYILSGAQTDIPLSKNAANGILLLWSLVCKTDMIDDHRREGAG